jgi:hypothetical protein
MRRTTTHSWRGARGAQHALRFLLAGCAILSAGVLSPNLALAGGVRACEVHPPTIEGVRLTGAPTLAGVSLEAQINTHNAETTYEFRIVWRGLNSTERGEALPGGPIAHEGWIAAGAGVVTVSTLLSGLQPGYTYWYEVVASNLGGTETSGASGFAYFNGGADEGGGPVYTPGNWEGCEIESGDEAAIRTVQEQRAKEAAAIKEQEESKTREAARLAAEEAARKRHEEEAAVAAQREAPACTVPSLRGDTLAAARRALAKTHCRLGKVSRPAHRHAALIVARQSTRNGEKLPDGAAVAVTLAPRPRGKAA